MLKEVRIENYKSIHKLKLELGRVTVLIGENGCGKSNILEAIALASAAASDKLDNEFLAARGIRVTEPRFMRSAFEKENLVKDIEIDIKGNDEEKFSCILHNDNSPYSQWVNKKKDIVYKSSIDDFSKLVATQYVMLINDSQQEASESPKEEQLKVKLKETLRELLNATAITPEMLKAITPEFLLASTNISFKEFCDSSKLLSSLIKFTIYSPENQALRTFEKEGQIQPLGINGEGLFKLINVLNADNPDQLNQIKEKLRLIDWFKDFEVPQNLSAMQTSLQITDRYLDTDLSYFDQRSSNEGFLFLLFYFTLFISDLTPKFLQ